MTPERERLVRESWPILEARGEEAAQLFYAHLFELDETARGLFDGVDMRHQGIKFVAMLGSIVRSLDRAPVLVADLATLARRHVHYGVMRDHYESVGAALLFAIEEVLGDDCTPEVRSAWCEAYALLAAVMGRASGVASRDGGVEMGERATTAP